MSITEKLSESIENARLLAFKDPLLAFQMAETDLETARALGYKLQEAASLFVMALACRSMTDLNRCYTYTVEAQAIYEAEGSSTGQSATLNLLGVIYFYYANYEYATELFMKALSFAEKNDDQVIISRIYNNLGEVYREIGDYGYALDAYEKALKISEAHNFEINIPVILENIGDVYLRNRDYDESFKYFSRSMALLEVLEDFTALSEVECKLGKLYFDKGNYEEAKACYDRSLNRLEAINNKFFAIDVLINLSEYMAFIGDEKAFLKYLNLGAKYGEELHAIKKLSHIYKQLTGFFERKCIFDMALEYYKRYHHMEQTLETTVVSKKLEIIKLEINQRLSSEELVHVKMLNQQLEKEISAQVELLEKLERDNQQLTQEVQIDELTQIASRRGFRQHLENHFHNHAQPLNSGSLFMLDIDHFKRYNDTLGHIEGDECLKIIAKQLKLCLQDHQGIAGRYGGEEFICFVQGLSREETLGLAECLRLSVESLKLSYEWENQMCPVTISIGIAYEACMHFEHMHQMFVRADEQLYLAKNAGRNCVRMMA